MASSPTIILVVNFGLKSCSSLLLARTPTTEKILLLVVVGGDANNGRQVISITHTPQIAARADAHYFVFKKVEGQRTVTNVRYLAPEERLRSIAVMLSGNPPSETAIATARELVEG